MKFAKGQSGNPNGRPKVTEQTFMDLLIRDSIKAYKLLWVQMRKGEPWAFKIYFELLSIELKEMEDISDTCPMCNDPDSELSRNAQVYNSYDN
jgi:hypothetical protein